MEPHDTHRDYGGKSGVFFEVLRFVKAHSRFAPVPGAFSKMQRAGG
jgi:hypothetical protein